MENSYRVDEALRDAHHSRAAAATRVITPWWYHPAIGLVEAAIILGVTAFADTIWTWVLLGLALAAMCCMVKIYQSITGVWVGPENAGPRSRPLWIAVGGVVLLCLVLAYLIQWQRWSAWLAWADAALVLLAVTVLGRAFDKALRADIAAGDTPLPVRTR